MSVNKDTDQTIQSSTGAVPRFENELFGFDRVGAGQSGEMHGTPNSRLVAPRTGIYQVSVVTAWQGSNQGATTDSPQLYIRLERSMNGNCSLSFGGPYGMATSRLRFFTTADFEALVPLN